MINDMRFTYDHVEICIIPERTCHVTGVRKNVYCMQLIHGLF